MTAKDDDASERDVPEAPHRDGAVVPADDGPILRMLEAEAQSIAGLINRSICDVTSAAL